MIEAIRRLLKRAWNFLKKVFTTIVDFIKNIYGFFKAKWYSVIKKHPKAVGISLKIKDHIKNGDFNTINLSEDMIVNTFYDQDTGNIIEEETEVISYESLDETTKQKFGDKEMLTIEN